MTRKVLEVLILVLAAAFADGSARAQDAIDPDRPDVTNTVNTVPRGVGQVEAGGVFVHESSATDSLGVPVTLRVGITDGFEARAELGGLISQSSSGVRTNGFGDTALGAKIRLRRASVLPVSIQPAINLPTASAEKGFGSGDADYTLTVLSRVDLSEQWQLGMNYRIGAIGGGGGTHFAQHLLSASAGLTAGKWNPYFEVYWMNRAELDGRAVTAFDTGTLFLVTPRLALDAGLQLGISHDAPDFSCFGGISFMLGR
jgi:hypothetical protein